MENYVKNFRPVYGSMGNEEVDVIPNGVHTVRIERAEEKVSKRGNEMIQVTLKVKDYNTPVRYFILLKYETEADTEKTNRKITQFMFNFGIPFGEFRFDKWVNNVGKAEIETANGSRYPSVKYWEFDRNAFKDAIDDYFALQNDEEFAPENFEDDTDIPF